MNILKREKKDKATHRCFVLEIVGKKRGIMNYRRLNLLLDNGGLERVPRSR
jgi:hypothetical protein